MEEGTEDHISFTCCILKTFTPCLHRDHHLGILRCLSSQLVKISTVALESVASQSFNTAGGLASEVFLVRSKETTLFTFFSWSIVDPTNKESSGPVLSAQFLGRSWIFQKFSCLLKTRPWFCVLKSVAGNSTYCTTPDTSMSLMMSRLHPIYWWFRLRASFPWVSVALAEWQTAVCISTALSSLSYLHEKTLMYRNAQYLSIYYINTTFTVGCFTTLNHLGTCSLLSL